MTTSVFKSAALMKIVLYLHAKKGTVNLLEMEASSLSADNVLPFSEKQSIIVFVL
jgi:hypothetical protein